MLEAGLVIARFSHYVAAMTLFGLSLFPIYAYSSVNRLYREDANANWKRTAAVAALFSALLWLAFVTAEMAGDLSAAVDGSALIPVLTDTMFGSVWVPRLALSALIIGLTAGRAGKAPGIAVTVLSAALLASLAGTGHTMHSEGTARAAHVVSDAAHLLAAGAWLGGLIALARVLRGNAPDASDVLRRFSGMGYIAVAVLVGSGLINSWFLAGTLSNLFATLYGRLLFIKLGLFAAMLGLAAANRFWLVPAFANTSGATTAAARRLRLHVAAELILGVLIICIVSVLGTLEPAAG